MRLNTSWLLVMAFAIIVVVVAATISMPAATTVNVERETNVTAVTDETAALALIDGHPERGFVEQIDSGTLSIDLTRGGGGGANSDATIRIGSEGAPVSDHAFRIANEGSQTRSISVEYSLDSGGAGGGDENLRFVLHHDAGDDGTIDATDTATENTGSSATIANVDPGDPVYVTVRIDTAGLSTTNDLSGELTVTASGGG